MINLLPPELKTDYQYARRNTRMVRIIMTFAVGFAGLAAITFAGVIYLQQSAHGYTAQASGVQQRLKEQKQSEVETQVQDISNSLKLAVQVLSQEVLFSQLLKQLGSAVPSNANLSGITISNLQGAVDVSAHTTNYSTATQLQVNLSDPANKIFSKADILNISCSSGATVQSQRYPCTVQIRAQFADNNPFLFINSKVGGR